MIHVIEYFMLINDKMVSMYVCRRMYMYVYVCMYVYICMYVCTSGYRNAYFWPKHDQIKRLRKFRHRRFRRDLMLKQCWLKNTEFP